MTLSTFKKSDKSREPHYLLLGHPVEHSWSPLMHNTALNHYGMDARYYAIDLQNRELTDLASYMNRDTFLGANVTIPYKQLIKDYLDDISGQADTIGAVNTIVRRNYHLEGHNTDCDGFLAPLGQHEDELEGGTAIVFGTGGASKAVAAALEQIHMERVYLVSRSPERRQNFDRFGSTAVISYNEWTSVAEDAALIVNATPLGMHPDIDTSPVRDMEQQFLAGSICYDIVYNPLETKFLKQASSVGAETIGGLEMLIWQGSESFRLWTGKQFPIQKIRDTLHEKIGS